MSTCACCREKRRRRLKAKRSRAAKMGWARRRLRESRDRRRGVGRPGLLREGLTFGSLDELMAYMNGPERMRHYVPIGEEDRAGYQGA